MNVATLVFGHRPAGSSQVLLRAAAERGVRVIEVVGEAVAGTLRGSGAHLYSGLRLADRLAAELGTALLETPAAWLAELPSAFTGRDVDLMPIAEAYGLRRPVFVKSPNSKNIRAMMYVDGSRLPGADAVDPSTPVLVSDVVRFTAEFRLYVYDGVVHTGSQYAVEGCARTVPLDGHPQRSSVLGFARDLLDECAHTVPSAIVIDVGTMRDSLGDECWSVVEANGAWGSGCYAADPQRALDVVLRAAGPAAALTEHDRQFVRARTAWSAG